MSTNEEDYLAGPLDITARVHAAGWTTAGLTVTAYTLADETASPADADCYTKTQIDAWDRGEWRYVGVVIAVTDENGFEWARDSLWSVESGWWTDTDDDDNVTGERQLDPLTDPDHPLPDMIPEVMAEAANRLRDYTMPTIAAP